LEMDAQKIIEVLDELTIKIAWLTEHY